MDKYESDVEAVIDALASSPRGLMLVECAIKAERSIDDTRYVLDCLVLDKRVIEEEKSILKVKIYRRK